VALGPLVAAHCPAGRVTVEAWVTVALPEELLAARRVARAAAMANKCTRCRLRQRHAGVKSCSS
jgi:hypothetical protein